MTYVWLILLALEAVAFVAKEHADRQKTHKVMWFVSGDRPDYTKWLVVNKSWWQQIKENLKPIVWACLGAGLLWVATRIF